MSETNGNGLDRRTEQYRLRMTILAGISTAGVLALCGWFYQIDGDVRDTKTKYALQVPDLEKRIERDEAKIDDLYRLVWQGGGSPHGGK